MGQSVETNPKEIFIQAANCCERGFFENINSDRANLSQIPKLIAPLLQKIGIALCDTDNFVDCLVCNAFSLLTDWADYGFARPASSGGRVPAPGVKGLRVSSIGLRLFIAIYTVKSV
jgi:hypothetical protein